MVERVLHNSGRPYSLRAEGGTMPDSGRSAYEDPFEAPNVFCVSFLWQLLPGVREARNQVLIGYAYLLALGIGFGVPTPPRGSTLNELVDAAGVVGVGVALSVVAFLIGSISDDVVQHMFNIRGALTFTFDMQEDPASTVRRIEEWGLRAELERLEAAIDRLNSEVLLRAGLLFPISGIAVAAAVTGGKGWWAMLGAALALFALSIQILWRYTRLAHAIKNSVKLRASVSTSLIADPGHGRSHS